MAKKQIPDIDRGILSPKEKFCLNGYVYMHHKDSSNDEQLRLMAFMFSRPKMPTGNKDLVELRAIKWFEHSTVQSYILQIQPKTERIVNNIEDLAPIEKKEEVNTDDEDSLAQAYIKELEEMKSSAIDLDEKLKIIKVQHDIIHKSKDKFKEETKTTRIYLPHQSRCKECPLYLNELKTIKK